MQLVALLVGPADLSPLASTEHPSLAETSPGAGHVEPVEREEPPVPRQLHPSLDVALHEALTKVNSARHDWIERVGEPNREITRGNYQRMADFQVSTTDPDATLMQGKAGGSHLGYHTHYIVDGGKARIMLAALVTPSEVMENQPVLDLLWRTRFRWKVHARQFTGDTTYGTAENIVALEEQQIREDDASAAMSMKTILSVSEPITRRSLTRKQCERGVSGSNRSKLQGSSGKA